MRLSAHFTLSELSHTGQAAYAAQNAHEAELHQDVLRAVCDLLLEPIRAHFGPVTIHSGYRCPELNAAIGGAKSSQHMKGEAADFHVAGHSLEEVWTWIRDSSGIQVGQCLLEGHGGAPTWIHISLGAPYRIASKCGQFIVVKDG